MFKPPIYLKLYAHSIREHIRSISSYLALVRFLWWVPAGIFFILSCISGLYLLFNVLSFLSYGDLQHLLDFFLAFCIFILSFSPAIIVLQRYHYVTLMEGRVEMLSEIFNHLEFILNQKTVAIEGEWNNSFPGVESIYRADIQESFKSIFDKELGWYETVWADLNIHFNNGYRLRLVFSDKVKMKSLFDYLLILFLIKLSLLGIVTVLKLLPVIFKNTFNFLTNFVTPGSAKPGTVFLVGREIFIQDISQSQSYTLFYEPTGIDAEHYNVYNMSHFALECIKPWFRSFQNERLKSSKIKSPSSVKESSEIKSVSHLKTASLQFNQQVLTRSTRRHKKMLESCELKLTFEQIDNHKICFKYYAIDFELSAVRYKKHYYSIISCNFGHLNGTFDEILLAANQNLLYGRFARKGERVVFLKSFLHECFQL